MRNSANPKARPLSLYRGRFAPSPTGPLHFGSLLTALASYLDAKHNKGLWFIRIEDLDPPRETAHAKNDILNALKAFGLHPDDHILYQSQRHELYESVCQQLLREKKAYYCTCSRSQLAPFKGIYPGTCRRSLNDANTTPPEKPYSIRFKTSDIRILFHDDIQGDFEQNITKEVGDFIIKRKDGFYAYQLAVVVDDHAQKINHVVRGSDLLDNTPRQILLQQALAYELPNYAHLPIVVNQQGQKLSKQTFADAIPIDNPVPSLLMALRLLGFQPHEDFIEASVEDILAWAIKHWSINNVPRTPNVLYPTLD